MTEIEDRLRDAFRADAQTVRPEAIRPFARPEVEEAAGIRRARAHQAAEPRRLSLPRPLRRVGDGTSRRLIGPLAAAAAVAVVVFGTVLVVPRIWPGTRSATRHYHVSGPIRPLDTFLDVTTSPPVIRGDHLIRYPVTTLQLRSVLHGRLIADLLHSLGGIDAVIAQDGSVIAVVDEGCRSRVLRISPSTGHSTLLRTLPQSAQDIALSPDGRRLAYLTYPASDPQHCSPVRQPARPLRFLANPGGLAQFGPSVLAVVNLTSGTLVRAGGQPGSGPGAPLWSPDGSQMAVVLSGKIAVLSASHPDLATAGQLSPPKGCGYVTATWTVRGIMAVLGCGKQDPALSPGTIVRLSAAGQRTASWQLPACVDGVGLRADPTARHVLVESDIGYGNGRPCGYPHPGGNSIRIAIVGPTTLETIAVFPQKNNLFQVVGW
jgi:WD40-like Beta Propeller Repeat